MALLRSGIVLSNHGGVLAPLRPLFLLGLGGPMGNGRQYWPWISMADATGAISHILGDATMFGPVNLVAPQQTTNRAFAHALGRALHRPSLLPLPAIAIRLSLGQMGVETLLSSALVRPAKLAAADFVYQHADLKAAMTWACDRRGR